MGAEGKGVDPGKRWKVSVRIRCDSSLALVHGKFKL